jgi:hypothetical protein
MPLSLSRHPSAPVPFYYPPSHPGYAHHHQHYSQYPPQYGMFDQYSGGGGNPYQRGYFPPDHHPLFQQFPRGIPNNGDYPPSRYGEFNPRVDYNFQRGNGNIMDPPNSSGAIMGVVDDTERDGRFLEEEEESPDSDDEADEFAPIPIQYSPKSMMRKSDGNSVTKLE